MLPVRAYGLIRCGAILAAIFLTAAPAARGAEAAPHVRFVYLVPHDRQSLPRYEQAIAAAARDIQRWLAQQTGMTFARDTSEVSIVRGRHPAAWYASAATPGRQAIAFYDNVVTELKQAQELRFNDPARRTVVYVDADLACGQSGAGGNGIAVMPANDLRGLAGAPIVPACGAPTAAERGGRCRWVGGSAHELLHTLGLGHSDQFDDCKTPACRQEALMMYGYTAYPNARLLEPEIARLRNSVFMRGHATAASAALCRD
jgi:hypothetical protein